jgi:diguanylate cyclase (GGDEF)-like protein
VKAVDEGFRTALSNTNTEIVTTRFGDTGFSEQRALIEDVLEKHPDIDFFKKYNDTLGHSAGDSCLKRISTILLNELNRGSDLLARYGGEEFLCLCPDTDHKGAVVIAEKLLWAVSASNIPHPASSIADHVTVSIGAVAMIPSSRSNPQSLIEIADARLYKAKNDGRNQVCTG